MEFLGRKFVGKKIWCTFAVRFGSQAEERGDARQKAMRLKGNQVRDLNRPATVISKNVLRHYHYYG